MFKLLALTAVAVGALGTAPASALETFASFSPANTTTNITYSDGSLFTNTGGASVAQGVDVLFNFLVGGDSSLQGLSATFTSSSVVPPSNLPSSGPFDLDATTGTFSFLSNEAITVNGMILAAGSNLLSGAFSNGFLSGTVDGTAGNLRGSTGSGSFITFTSDVLLFAPQSEYDFSFGLTAVQPPFGPAGGLLAAFDASAGGQFSAEPLPTLNPGDPSVVPEPMTWAMLVLGFGIVGVSARRRRNVVVA